MTFIARGLHRLGPVRIACPECYPEINPGRLCSDYNAERAVLTDTSPLMSARPGSHSEDHPLQRNSGEGAFGLAKTRKVGKRQTTPLAME